jgi:hypothetical protein
MSARILGGGVVLALGLVLAACGADLPDEGGEWQYQNQIFPDTTLVTPAQGGAASTPSFSWPAVNVRHVVCAVFAAHLSVTGDLIANPQDLRWVWHTGLGRGRDGNILYEDGAGDADGRTTAAPLPAGTYYWAVWAFDDAGVPVASSLEYQLTVP